MTQGEIRGTKGKFPYAPWLKIRNARMKSFVRGLPSSSSSSVFQRLLLILLLIAHQGRAEMEDNYDDPIALLRKTLKDWRWIYETYREEIKLGYCWADYLLGSSDIETDFISRIIENELTNLKEMSIRRKCENDSRYCEGDFSYGNPSRYGVNAESSFRRNYVEKENSEKDFEEISRANIEARHPSQRATTIDQEGNSNNDSNHWSTLPNYPSQFTSRSDDKRSRRWTGHEGSAAAAAATATATAAAASVKVAYRGYAVKPKVFSLLNKKLTMDHESSSSETSSSTYTDVARRLGWLPSRKVSDRDKGMTRGESSYFDKSDREETTATETILSLSGEKYGRKLDTLNGILVQRRDRRSSRENSKARTGRSFGRILSTTAEHPIFIEIIKTLTVLVRVGQLITDIVDSSDVLRCTRDYIVKRTIDWIDS